MKIISASWKWDISGRSESRYRFLSTTDQSPFKLIQKAHWGESSITEYRGGESEPTRDVERCRQMALLRRLAGDFHCVSRDSDSFSRYVNILQFQELPQPRTRRCGIKGNSTPVKTFGRPIGFGGGDARVVSNSRTTLRIRSEPTCTTSWTVRTDLKMGCQNTISCSWDHRVALIKSKVVPWNSDDRMLPAHRQCGESLIHAMPFPESLIGIATISANLTFPDELRKIHLFKIFSMDIQFDRESLNWGSISNASHDRLQIGETAHFLRLWVKTFWVFGQRPNARTSGYSSRVGNDQGNKCRQLE
jgi:hypothetical protein